MTAKEKHKNKLLEYLGNPGNEWLDRATLSTEVLGYKQENGIHKCFSPAELNEIEAEALELRRKKYASCLARVDSGLLKEAANGNPNAAKLVYQRFEDWAPKTKQEHSFSKENLKEIMEMLPETFKNAVIKKLETKIAGS